MSRARDRVEYEPKYHFVLLDDDQDRFEIAVTELARGVRRLTQVGVGLLVSITTAALLLILNLLAGGPH